MFVADLAANGTMMEKRRMLETRENGVMGDYCELMIHLVPSMVTAREWLMVRSGYENFSDVVTSTDEAHALLVIENNWNCLKFGASLEKKEQEKCNKTSWVSEEEEELYGTEMPRYTRTNGGRTRNGRQGKTGWSQDGLDRFNSLVDLVQQGRKDRGKVFNAAMKKRCSDMVEETKQNKKRKRGRTREEEETFRKLEQFEVACNFEYKVV